MSHFDPRFFITAARNDILACDAYDWRPPYGWRISMQNLQTVWRKHGPHHFSLALDELVRQGRVRILAVDRLYLTTPNLRPEKT